MLNRFRLSLNKLKSRFYCEFRNRISFVFVLLILQLAFLSGSVFPKTCIIETGRPIGLVSWVNEDEINFQVNYRLEGRRKSSKIFNLDLNNSKISLLDEKGFREERLYFPDPSGKHIIYYDYNTDRIVISENDNIILDQKLNSYLHPRWQYPKIWLMLLNEDYFILKYDSGFNKMSLFAYSFKETTFKKIKDVPINLYPGSGSGRILDNHKNQYYILPVFSDFLPLPSNQDKVINVNYEVYTYDFVKNKFELKFKIKNGYVRKIRETDQGTYLTFEDEKSCNQNLCLLNNTDNSLKIMKEKVCDFIVTNKYIITAEYLKEFGSNPVVLSKLLNLLEHQFFFMISPSGKKFAIVELIDKNQYKYRIDIYELE